LETAFVITTPSHGAEPDEAASVTLSGVGNPPGEDCPVDQSAQWGYEQPGKGDNFLLFKIRLESPVRRTLIVAAFVFGACSSLATFCTTPNLDSRQRLGAQEAIERYCQAHQIGDNRSFDQAVPRSVLEDRVQTYLKESVALERF